MRVRVNEGVLNLLDELTSMEVNLNHYWEEPGYADIIDGLLAARLKALAGYLRQLEMPDLLEVVLDLEPKGSVVETLETIRAYVEPEARKRLDDPTLAPPPKYKTPNDALMEEIEAQRGLMISVATDGPRIQAVDQEYTERRRHIASGLSERRIRDPNPFSDLWAWHGKWSSGDLPTYRSRRQFIGEMYNPLLDSLSSGPTVRVIEEATGWEAVDRGVDQIRRQLGMARSPEELQAIGLYCREALISLAQEVYNPKSHPSVDGVAPSRTDAKRMIEAFIASELVGDGNRYARKHAAAALDLANELQHRRTATYRHAALCAEATVSVIGIIAILCGKRGG